MNQRHTLRFAAIVAAMSAAGCQSLPDEPSKPEAPVQSAPASDLTSPKTDFGEAMMQPFTDFNITRDPIPTQLKAAAKAPYAGPADMSCPALAAETARLDAALGPDLDASSSADSDGDQMESMAAGALRSLTTDWIPFRGVLRRLTGAEAHAKAAREAILAGAVRRAYLKGLGERAGCAPPAAPIRRTAAP